MTGPPPAAHPSALPAGTPQLYSRPFSPQRISLRSPALAHAATQQRAGRR